MKVTIDIKDNKVPFFMELMKSLDFVNAAKGGKTISKKGAINHKSTTADQLSMHEILKIKEEWDQKTAYEKKEKLAALQTLLLQGPVMDNGQYEEYKKMRNRFNAWRQS